MNNHEQEFINQLKKGEDGAFRTLFDVYYHLLFCVANQYVKDDFTADTIVGDTLFHIWEQRNTLSIETSLQAYLIRSVRNLAINHLKQTFLEREISLENYNDTPESILQGLFISDEYPLGALLEKELSERIHTEIDKLPAETRQVFILNRIQGLEYKEVADQIGISVNTVKYHVKQALSILRIRLKDFLMNLFW